MNASSKASALCLILIGALAACDRKEPEQGGGAANGPAESPRTPIPVRVAPEEEGAERHLLGEIVADLVLHPIGSPATSLAAFADGRPLVIATRDLKCPIAKKFGPQTGRLEAMFQPRGVKWMYLNPTLVDDEEAMERDRGLYHLQGPYVPDKDLSISRYLRISSTTEVFLLDKDRRLVYRGAIDDRYGFGFSHDEPKRRFLEDAIEAVLAGRKPPVESTTAPGCFIDLSMPGPVPAAVDYHGAVSRILQKRCQRCHREGENAPFSLGDYDEVTARKGMIRYTVRNRIMPPWFADAGVGGPWLDDLRLEAGERDTLLAWLDAGCPEGDPAQAPEPLPEVKGWKIGEPDAVFHAPYLPELPADGEIPYQYCIVETDFPEDRWLSKIEVRNEVPEALHHILVFEYLPEMQKVDPIFFGGLALKGFFAITSPGCEPIQYPADRAKLLKKGTKLFFQIHYVAIGKPFRDRARIGFGFAAEKPRYSVLCSAASSKHIIIPPGAPHHVVEAVSVIPKRAMILGFNPHMHARGKSFLMELIYPDGRVETALRVSDWDFNWQQAYRLKEPIEVPAGTTVRAVATYDNSADNPANPDPTVTVYFGLRTEDEMMIGYYEWVALDP